MSNNGDTEDSSDFSLSDRPLGYVIFPLIGLALGALVGAIIYRRRRRNKFTALHSNWPHPDRSTSHIGVSSRRVRPSRNNVGSSGDGTGRRWGPWGATRSQEGLNELGEAPPPYDGKRDAGDAREVELRDLEAGRGLASPAGPAHDSPPDYPAEPGPAVTREQRAS